jgi:hypothetical protein
MSVVIETQMLIRKSINIVFNAFVDPLITQHFWFSASSGYLEEGKTCNGLGRNIMQSPM